MDDLEQQVQAEIDRLEGPDFPRGRLAKRQRDETIRALAEATVEGRSWTGDHGVLGKKRPPMVVSDKNFYTKKHWWPNPLTQEVIANVTELYRARDAAERESARQAKRAWLENKEMEAATAQFDKAADLLALPHIAKKTKQGKGDEGTTIILDPANAAVFNAAVNLNESGSKLARRSLGLPLDTTKSETAVSTTGPIQVTADMTGLDDKAIDALISNLKTALGAGDDREATPIKSADAD